VSGTFIKLDRSLLKHRYFGNVNVLKVWLWCLMKATHTPHKQLVGLQTVELEIGQFVTGRAAMGRDLNMPGSTAWTILTLFKNDEKLNINSNNKYSVITVINFTSYQMEKYKHRQQNGQHPDNTLTTPGQHPDTNKNDKEGKEGKEEKPKVNRFAPPSIEEVAAYCSERKNNVDPQKFHDHYETRNWIPKGYTKQMSNWKAAVRTWEGNNNGNIQFGKGTSPAGRKESNFEANGPGADWLGDGKGSGS
jgi:hypothetical protein